MSTSSLLFWWPRLFEHLNDLVLLFLRGMKATKSLLQIKNIHPLVDGKRMVQSISNEEGVPEGPTLLTVEGVPTINGYDSNMVGLYQKHAALQVTRLILPQNVFT